MRYTVRKIDREFTPGEVAEITGVSTAMQRDWRRRELLPESGEGKWTRFSLTWVIRLSVMKLFSDAGIDVSKTSVVADLAVLPTLHAIYLMDEAVAFDGDDIPEASMARIRATTVVTTGHKPGRYIARTGDHELDFFRAESLEKFESLLDKRQPVISVIDCYSLASRIVERAGGAVTRYEIEMADNG